MNLVWLVLAALSGQWILDSQGLGNPTDFANVYAAGRLALDGHPALAWDWDAHKLIQEQVLGQSFDGYFGWHYPPPYLLVASALARLPYAVAFAGWVAVSFVPFAIVVRRLAGHPVGWLIACACPLTLHNVMIGQNGFLTAALMGGAILSMPRPDESASRWSGAWLSGICIGCLIYKPQYGLLFPLVLVAARQWAVFIIAALTVALLCGLSGLVFGTQAWIAFFTWMPRASQAFLVDGFAQFGKMQSALSFARYLGGGAELAEILQWSMSGAAALVLILLWRSRIAFAVKAAALVTAVLLATPYLYPYDMVALALPMAMLVRIGTASGFLSLELPMLALATLLLVAFPFVVAPIGFLATLIVAALIGRRAMIDLAHVPQPPLSAVVA